VPVDPFASVTASPTRAAGEIAAVIPVAVGVEVTDFGISVRHLDRLLGGLLLATAPRLDWAKLLRRTFAIDAMRCAHCGGRLRLLAAITDRATARRILEHLGLPAEAAGASPRARDEPGADAYSAPG
jgi:hypothetical protein